ncbi:MAG: hypothetical protein VX940_04500 [Pseudomonadota bacterium]|nr:hypothetical protein [Pseudomonadota bacterium]
MRLQRDPKGHSFGFRGAQIMNSVFGINSFTGLYAGTNTPDLAATAETTATDWTKGASAKTLLEESQKVQRAERLEQRKEAEANMKRLEDNARAIAFALKTKEMQKALATLQQDNSQSSHLMLLVVTDEGDIHAFFPPPLQTPSAPALATMPCPTLAG